MPADYRIDRAKGVVFSRAWGPVSKQEMRDYGRRLRADPDFRPELKQLWDLTAITRTSLDYTELTALAQTRTFAPDSRRAILAPHDLAFGMARMLQAVREKAGETNIRVFRTWPEALRWLELGEEPARPPV